MFEIRRRLSLQAPDHASEESLPSPASQIAHFLTVVGATNGNLIHYQGLRNNFRFPSSSSQSISQSASLKYWSKSSLSAHPSIPCWKSASRDVWMRKSPVLSILSCT